MYELYVDVFIRFFFNALKIALKETGNYAPMTVWIEVFTFP